METGNVLADKVMQLGGAVLAPVGIEVMPVGVAPVLETGHVADGCIQPYVKILARSIRNFETPVRRIARDIPVLEAFIQPFVHLVGDFGLYVSGSSPALEHLFEIFQLEEILLGVFFDGRFTTDHRNSILEVGRCVGGAAILAIVTILIGGAAVGAVTLDEAIRQEHFRLGVVSLGDYAGTNVPGIAQATVDGLGEEPVLVGMRTVIVVKSDPKIREILQVLLVHAFDQFFRAYAFGLGAQHNGCAMGIIRADVNAIVTAQLLKTHPDIRLHVLEHVADVDRAICIGQCAGDYYLARLGAHEFG